MVKVGLVPVGVDASLQVMIAEPKPGPEMEAISGQNLPEKCELRTIDRAYFCAFEPKLNLPEMPKTQFCKF